MRDRTLAVCGVAVLTLVAWALASVTFAGTPVNAGHNAAVASRSSSRSPTASTIASSALSKAFGRVPLARYHDLTGMPLSDYDGTNGISYRDDLAGLNLTTVPKVLIECGNMRNSTDAALLVRPSFQRLAARAFAQAITSYLQATS
jgi:N-acetylmuramoyl-L-alanine amidase